MQEGVQELCVQEFIVANFPEGDSGTFMRALSTREFLTTPTMSVPHLQTKQGQRLFTVGTQSHAGAKIVIVLTFLY